MNILQVELNNFVGYAGVHTLPVETGLNNLRGKNGSGKSNILYAIEWCLDGTTSSGIKAGDVIHHGEKTASVTLVTDMGTIVRSQRPNRITLDGETVTQQRLYDVIGSGATAAINACSLNILTATPSARKEMLDGIIGDTGWDESINRATDARKESANAITELERDMSVAVAKTEWILENKPIDTRQQRVGELYDRAEYEKEAARKSIDKEVALLEQGLASLNEQVSLCTDTKQDAIDNATKKRDEAQESYACMIDMLMPVPDEVDIELADEKLAKSRRFLESFRGKIRADKSAIDNLTSGTHCSQCGNELKEIDKDAVGIIEKRIAVSEKMLDKCKQRVSDNMDILASEHSKEDANKKALHEYQQHERDKEKALSFVTRAEDAISAEKERDFTAPILARITRTGEQLEKAKLSYDATLADIDYSASIESILAEDDPLLAHKSKVATVNKNATEIKKELANAQTYAVCTTDVLAAFKEASVLPYQDLCADISRRIRHYTASVLAGWDVVITIESETASSIQRKINASITDADGNPVKWRSLSEGQKQRLALAANFAIIDIVATGDRSNVEFYDEQLSKVDTEAKNDILDLLKQRADDTNRAIYIVEHTATGYPFDNIISVSRDKGCSSFTITTDAL